ncbi:tRNA (guanosine(37)-N1)-methyltransferase TrmD [bacterium RCC_150]
MRIDVVSIFPEYLAPLDLSLIGKARQDGLLELNVHDLRSFTTDKHRTVDDTPYGGGAGMVMKPEPWALALESIAGSEGAGSEGAGSGDAGSGDAVKKPVLIVPSPAGERFTQALAYELAEEERLVFACGRYEGIDERVMEWAHEHFTVRPVSLGDYVLNGGEVAVLAMVEAIGRLLPGVVGNPESLVEESHSDGLLEYPVYTKPSTWRDREVPAVLLSGNHGKIAQWRRHEQFRRTAERRPDLLEEFDAGHLTRPDRAAFDELGYEVVDGRLRRRPDSDLPA